MFFIAQFTSSALLLIWIHFYIKKIANLAYMQEIYQKYVMEKYIYLLIIKELNNTCIKFNLQFQLLSNFNFSIFFLRIKTLFLVLFYSSFFWLRFSPSFYLVFLIIWNLLLSSFSVVSSSLHSLWPPPLFLLSSFSLVSSFLPSPPFYLFLFPLPPPLLLLSFSAAVSRCGGLCYSPPFSSP